MEGIPSAIGEDLVKDIIQFEQLISSGQADINKFRYADDSMFHMRSGAEMRNTLIKKWTVEIFQKNHKK